MKNIFRKLKANESLIMTCLQIYRKLLSLATFLWVHSHFLSAIWLPHDQLWATIEGAASLTRCSSLRFTYYYKGHQEPRNKVGSQSPTEHLVGFKPGTLWFWMECLNPLGHSSWKEKLMILQKRCPTSRDKWSILTWKLHFISS